jgi:glutathione peroxidase-family protein
MIPHRSVLFFACSLCLAAAPMGCQRPAAPTDDERRSPAVASIHDLTMKDIDGNDVSLATFRGKVVMIVNVASKCGFTKQYAGLQRLYERYRERGFVILGFPANNFLWQEPGSDGEIKQFCSVRYGVTFPMFSKISVKGSGQHALYRYLTDEKTNPGFGGRITWNFNKFLVDRAGRVVARFGARTKPEDASVIEAVEKALGGS